MAAAAVVAAAVAAAAVVAAAVAAVAAVAAAVAAKQLTILFDESHEQKKDRHQNIVAQQ